MPCATISMGTTVVLSRMKVLILFILLKCLKNFVNL